MAIQEEVIIVLNAETGKYEAQIKGATRATDQLGDSIDDVEGKANLGAEAVGDLGVAAKQTGEAAVDSATGISGLGAAMSNIAGRVRTATMALSSFSKALIATGIGAAIAALVLIAAYWEEISEWIGISNNRLEKFQKEGEAAAKANEKLIKALERDLELLEAMGLTEDSDDAKESILEARLKGAQDELKNLDDQATAIISSDVSGFWALIKSGLGITQLISDEAAQQLVDINEQTDELGETIKDLENDIKVLDASAATDFAERLKESMMPTEEDDDDSFIFGDQAFKEAQEFQQSILDLTTETQQQITEEERIQNEIRNKQTADALAKDEKA